MKKQQPDEFWMYGFKVGLCNEVHDWRECPLAHRGEKIRRRDPQKYYYTCNPCHEFLNGSCSKGDTCQYAHGVFESGLHPSRYKTTLCNNGPNCKREVCFFAHKPEELRLLNATASSDLLSPTLYSNSPSASARYPFTLSSPSALMQSSSMPPWKPSAISSPAGRRTMWQSPTQIRTTVPTPQMPSNRLNTALNARDNTHLDMKFLENCHMPKLTTKESSRLAGVNPTNLESIFGSSIQSLTGMQVHQNVNQQLRGYPSHLTNSNVVRSQQFRVDPFSNSRYDHAFPKRSQNFIECSSMASINSKLPALTSVALEPSTAFSDSAFLNDTSNTSTMAAASDVDEHDVLLKHEAWVNSLVKDDDPTLESD